MTTSSVRFRCPRCHVRIKAPVQLSGQPRDCPGCRHPLTVPYLVPDDAEPILVLIEEEERCSLGVGYRRGA